MVTVHTSTTVIEAPSGDDIRGGPPGAQLEQIYKDLAKELAKEFSRAVISDIKLVWEDVQRQYRDHNQLLARQEWCVQELKACLSAQGGRGMLLGGSRLPSEGDPKGPPAVATLVEVREPSITSELVTPRVQGKMHDCFCNFETPRAIKGAHTPKSTSRQKAGQPDVESWVAERLNLPRMSPRICPPPPPPVEDPHGTMPAALDNCDAAAPPGEPQHLVVFPLPAEPSWALKGQKSCTFAETGDGAGQDGDNDPEAEGNRGGEEANRRKSVQKVDRLFGDLGIDKSNLATEEYKVENFYYSSGFCQHLARNELFANITLAVIGANAIYIGVDADNNHEDNLTDADIGFQIMEHLFCTFFTFEWVVRFGAFRNKCNCLRDMWFKFDTALVLMMVVETWIVPLAFAGSGGTGIPTGLVKMLRLLRLARMARLMRAFPELVAMIKGVKQASRAVGSALLLLIGLVYVFAIIMYTLLKDESNPLIIARFGRLGTVMVTLITDGAFMDGIGYVSRTLLDDKHMSHAKKYLSESVFMVFVLLSALTVMNMLIGVLCEVVSAVAAAEKEDGQIRLVKDKLLCMLRELDEDGSGMISRDEIQQVLDNDAALAVLESLCVDVPNLMEELNLCFESADDLTIHQIMDLILMLRGDRSLTMKDLKHAHDFSIWKTKHLLGQALPRLEAESAEPATPVTIPRGTLPSVEESPGSGERPSRPQSCAISPPVREPGLPEGP